MPDSGASRGGAPAGPSARTDRGGVPGIPGGSGLVDLGRTGGGTASRMGHPARRHHSTGTSSRHRNTDQRLAYAPSRRVERGARLNRLAGDHVVVVTPDNEIRNER